MPNNSFARAGLTGIFFFLAAWLGVEQTATPDGIAILWPANAALLAALLMTSREEWPLLLVAALAGCSAALFAASFPLWSLALIGLVNTFECLFAAVLIRRFAGKELDLQSLRGMIVFLVAGPLVACSLAAVVGASIFESFGRTDNAFVVLWRLWWFSDAVGMIVFTPLVIAVWNIKISDQVFSKKRLMNLAELAVILAGVTITGSFALHTVLHENIGNLHGNIEVFLTPVLLMGFATWAAVRLDMLATTITLTLISVLLTTFLVQPATFFTTVMSPQEAVWLTQEYLVVISIIAVGLSGLMQNFRRQQASLRLLDRAMAASNDAISIVDVQQPGMPVTWVNPRFEELFGYSAEEIVGRNWGLLQEGIRQQYGLETLSAALADNKPSQTELQNFTKDGKRLWIDFSLAPVSDRNGQVTHFVAIHHDRTRAKETEERSAYLQEANEELEQVASVDFLTGIANRRHFYELGQRELTRLRRDGLDAALIAFDLDNFKAINDTFGHEAGDQLLRQIVLPVEKLIRPSDSFGRVGGDEFLILFTDTPESRAVEVAERIRTEISQILSSYGSARLGVTASFGVAGWDHRCDLSQLIRRADLALYQAKEEGRNSVCTWHQELDRPVQVSGLSNAVSGTG